MPLGARAVAALARWPRPARRRRRRAERAGGGPARGAGRAGRSWRGPSPSSTGRSRAARSCSSTRSSPASRRVRRRARCRRAGGTSWSRPTSYRGRAYFGIGLPEKASENFRQLVQLKPDHALSKEKVSPKIVDLFNTVKKALVGYLAVSSQPAGRPGHARRARATCAPTWGSPTSSRSRSWPATTRSRSPRTGYQTETRDGQHRGARRPRPCEVPLVRVLASAFFVTEPAGVEVWVDGELRATTAGNLAPELHEVARARGPRSRAGLGAHRDREPLARQPRRRAAPQVLRDGQAHARHRRSRRTTTLDPDQAGGLARPRCTLTSDPPGARIFLNGEARGVTPAADRRDLLGQGARRGQARGRQVHQGPRARARTRRSASTARSGPTPRLPRRGGRERRRRALRSPTPSEKIQQNLSRLAALNFIVAPRETVDRILEPEQADAAGRSLPGSRHRPRRRPQGDGEAGGRPRGAGLPGGRAARGAAAAHGRACTCWPRATRWRSPWTSTFGESAAYAALLAAARRALRDLAALERPHHGGHAPARRRARAARRAGQPGRAGRHPGRGTWCSAPTASR